MLVAITGVSGSGKSTLLHDVLYQALAHAKKQTSMGGDAAALPVWDSVEGDDYIDEVVLVDQSPIGRTPRSNPVTYIKAFDAIRDLFASLPEAKKRGFTAGHFSFNIPGGRCENLPGRRHGHGRNAVPGRRGTDLRGVQRHALQAQVLEFAISGKNIHEVLNLTVKEALQFFAEAPEDHREAARAGGSRPGIPAAGAIGDDAFGRRGAAHEAGSPPAAGGARGGATDD